MKHAYFVCNWIYVKYERCHQKKWKVSKCVVFMRTFLCKQSISNYSNGMSRLHTPPALKDNTVFCIKESRIISKRWKYNLLPRKRVIVFHGQIDNTKLKRDSSSFAKSHCLFMPWYDFYLMSVWKRENPAFGNFFCKTLFMARQKWKHFNGVSFATPEDKIIVQQLSVCQ